MRKKELYELVDQPGAVLVAEIVPERNRYFVRVMGVHYKISRLQFEQLLDYGYFETDYSIDPTGGIGFELQIHKRR